jgi:F-type H+-transporting ATPase subunit delta
MSDLVAKRYVKALLKGDEDISVVYSNIKNIASAYRDEKFVSIITSADVTKSDKVNLICSFVDNIDNKTESLIRLLADNKRLNIIPDIADELKQEIALLNNSYEGIVYTNIELDKNYLDSIQDKFAKKFNITLVLTQSVCDYDGIKVDIEDLGIEIGFSKDRLKSQMMEHILKAV